MASASPYPPMQVAVVCRCRCTRREPLCTSPSTVSVPTITPSTTGLPTGPEMIPFVSALSSSTCEGGRWGNASSPDPVQRSVSRPLTVFPFEVKVITPCRTCSARVPWPGWCSTSWKCPVAMFGVSDQVPTGIFGPGTHSVGTAGVASVVAGGSGSGVIGGCSGDDCGSTVNGSSLVPYGVSGVCGSGVSGSGVSGGCVRGGAVTSPGVSGSGVSGG